MAEEFFYEQRVGNTERLLLTYEFPCDAKADSFVEFAEKAVEFAKEKPGIADFVLDIRNILSFPNSIAELRPAFDILSKNRAAHYIVVSSPEHKNYIPTLKLSFKLAKLSVRFTENPVRVNGQESSTDSTDDLEA